jgi:hypothetical protein
MLSIFKKLCIAVAVTSISTAIASDDVLLSCSSGRECSNRGFISGDFLYLKAFQSGLEDFGPLKIVNTTDSNGNIVSDTKQKKHFSNSKWDPGFRVGAGYHFGDIGWDIRAYWTQFHTRAKNHGDHGHDKWKLNFDVVDGVVSRAYDVGHCLTLTPVFGIRTSRIYQSVHSTFTTSETNVSGSVTTSDILTTSHIKNREDFLGAGPLVALEADWSFGRGFSLFINGDVAALYGNFDLHFDENHVFSNGSNHIHNKHRCQTSQFATDLAFGMRVRKNLFGNCICTFQLALEQHRYFNFTHLGNGDLSIDGGSISLGFEI